VNLGFLREIQGFVGFTDEDARHLHRLLEWLEPRLDGLTEAFYGALLRHPDARQVFKDEAQVERLKESLKRWAVKVCSGPYDEDYVQLRARIGRIHLQIGLPQRYMLTGMCIIRQFLSDLIHEKGSSLAEERGVKLAVDKILDCELAIMLQTYHEDLLGKLRRHERLAALGSVAVTINHELKNPIGVLKTSVDSLRRQCAQTEGPPDRERVKKHLEKLDRNIDKMHKNISSLLEYARYSDSNLEECDIHTVIDDALEESAIPAHVRVVKRYDPALPRIHADPVQIARVFVNLSRNAAEAMEHGGVLTIETASLPGGTRITFRDTGPGVPEDVREHIFEPLWTAKPHGTGMGLAICRNLVEAHRGKIWVESQEKGGGACFHVELPRRGEKV
jgi:signal transduction histidine kinase